MTGSVNPFGEPFLNLEIAGQDWVAIIDTGFNGDLELPEGLRSQVNARAKGKVLSLLAGGQQVVEEVFLVDFPFDGQTIIAEATFVTGKTLLLGTHLLRGYRLTIDFPARTVSLDRDV